MKKILFLSALLFCVAPLWGGLSPKPEMDFAFVYQTENKPAILPNTSEQIQCDDNQCINREPLGQYGIQKLYCEANKCFSIAYEYEPFQQLIIDFSDGIKRQSNVFPAPEELRSSFKVLVRENDLVVQSSTQQQPVNAVMRAEAWASLLIILLTEILAALAYLFYTQKSYKVLYAVVLGNLITMPLSWEVISKIIPEPTVLWLFSLIFEGIFFWALNTKRLTLRNAFALSVAVNVTSYSIGMILSFVIAPYLF